MGPAQRAVMTLEQMLEPQPAPTGDGPSIVDSLLPRLSSGIVREIVSLRREQGRERYGTELNAHNGRNAKADLLQELVDAMIYLAQDELENGVTFSASMYLLEAMVHRKILELR